MRVVHTVAELAADAGGVFVPTMGALHAGHASLVSQAARIAAGQRPVIVSIFVNPTQFNDASDFARYPKTLDADLSLCERAGANIVLVPSVEEVYAQSNLAIGGVVLGLIHFPPVAMQPLLEDAFRMGHFAGVCQVVSRLFDMVRPADAIFGQKDWQQLQVVRAMTERTHPSILITAGATVRESDGLAMSSRNRFLSAADRARAPAGYAALLAAQQQITPAAAEAAMVEVLTDAGLSVQYAVVRDAQTLLPLALPTVRPAQCLLACTLGTIRLIDNSPWLPTHA